MGRPARVEDVRGAPVGEIGSDGCGEGGEGEADAAGGHGGARHGGG